MDEMPIKQLGNCHKHIKSGLYARCPIGDLPAEFKDVKRIATMFRKSLEYAVVQKHGELSLYHSVVIRSAFKKLRAAEVAERFKAKSGGPPDGLSVEQWVQLDKHIISCEQGIVADFRELGLNLKDYSWLEDYSDLFQATNASKIDSKAIKPATNDSGTNSLTPTQGSRNEPTATG